MARGSTVQSGSDSYLRFKGTVSELVTPGPVALGAVELRVLWRVYPRKPEAVFERAYRGFQRRFADGNTSALVVVDYYSGERGELLIPLDDNPETLERLRAALSRP